MSLLEFKHESIFSEKPALGFIPIIASDNSNKIKKYSEVQVKYKCGRNKDKSNRGCPVHDQ